MQTSGVSSWALRYRAGGRARKLTLGGYPAVDLAKARKLAKVAQGEIAAARDPGAEKVAARRATAKVDDVGPSHAVREVRDEYLRLHISKKRQHTQRQAEGLLKREFARGTTCPSARSRGATSTGCSTRIVDRGHGASANRAPSLSQDDVLLGDRARHHRHLTC